MNIKSTQNIQENSETLLHGIFDLSCHFAVLFSKKSVSPAPLKERNSALDRICFRTLYIKEALVLELGYLYEVLFTEGKIME